MTSPITVLDSLVAALQKAADYNSDDTERPFDSLRSLMAGQTRSWGTKLCGRGASESNVYLSMAHQCADGGLAVEPRVSPWEQPSPGWLYPRTQG